MSRKRNKAIDRSETAKLLKMIPFERKKQENWLKHTKGAAHIDVMLLVGATMDQLKSPTRVTPSSIRSHLRHLEEIHGLLVVHEGGLYRFGNPPIAD